MRTTTTRPPLRQRGLTLVEIMVSMVLMLMVAIATVALYNVSSSSYRTVDANQELQDSARFAMEVIGQAARSAGYLLNSRAYKEIYAILDRGISPPEIRAWKVLR